MAKLNKRVIDSIAADDKDMVVWDENLTGFGLRAKPSGAKSFIVQYRNKNGRSRRLSLGQAGKLTLDQARKAAQRVLGEVADGKDPAEERQMARRGESIDQLCDLYMKDHCAGRCKDSTIAAHKWLMKRFIRPRLGNRKLLELRAADIAKLHADLQDTPYNANRVLGLLRAILNCAERWEMIPRGANPAAHIKPFPEKKRERYLTQDELDGLMAVLADGEAAGSIDPYITAAIRLLIFTGCRLGEILMLEWTSVDLDKGRLVFKKHKTDQHGAKIIPLNTPALDLLINLPRQENNPYAIIGEVPGNHLINLQKPWRRIRALAGLNDVRIHDLRHSFASFAVGAGLSLPIIGGLLGHKSVQTTARYAHLAHDPLKQASDLIGTVITARK